MSLSHIRDVRRRGGKPAFVRVVVGEGQKWLEDGPTLVCIGERDRPDAMDFTPLIGVWVTLHWLSGEQAIVHKVIDALEQAGAKLLGASGPGFTAALTSNREQDLQDAIRKERGLLCTT